MIQSLLHPETSKISVEALEARLSALERVDNRFAQQGGSAVTYDSNGRIATLVAGTITGQIVNAQIANIDFAKITSVSITNAMISSIDAGKITTGSISANRMSANVLDALQANISNLSSISANIGTITAGSITGVTITGSTLQTASSGARVVIDTSNTIKFYDSGGTLRGAFSAGAFGGSSMVGCSTNLYSAGSIFAINGLSGSYLDTDDIYSKNDASLSLHGDLVITGDGVLGASGNLTVDGWGSLGGDLDMNDNKITEIEYLHFNTSSNSSTNGYLWFYDGGGGNYYWRSRNGSWNGQFDQTGF